MRTIYFINSAKWTKVNFYSWYTPTDIVSDAWPGTAMTKVEGNIYSCTIPVDVPNIIFNDGTTQTADLIVPKHTGADDIYIFDFTTKKFELYEGSSDPQPTDPTTPSEPAPTEPSAPADTTDSDGDDGNNGFDPTVLIVIIAVGVVALAAAGIVVFVIIKKKNG